MSLLVHATAMHRRIGLAARRRKMPRSRPPKLIEVEYAKALQRVVDRSRATVYTLLAELPRILEQQDGTRVHALIRAARTHASLSASDRVTLSSRFGSRVAEYARAQFAKQVKAKLGVELASLLPRLPASSVRHHDAANPLDAFVHENVALIESLGDTPLEEIGMLVTRAFTNGMRAETLAKDIAERFNVADNRAMLIARDQIGKLNGQVSANQHKQMGIRKFTWRTVGDNRVRDEHEELEGNVYSYDDPPAEGMPGSPIQCRCCDEPVFDDILDELDALEAG